MYKHEIKEMNLDQINELLQNLEAQKKKKIEILKLEKEVLIFPQKALLDVANYQKKIENITDILEQKLGENWKISIHQNETIRIWNSQKSKELEEDEYYHIYLKVKDDEIVIENHTINKDDLNTISNFLNIKPLS